MPIHNKKAIGEARPSGRMLVQDVYRQLADKGFRKKDIARVLDAMLAIWTRALARGERVEVPYGWLKREAARKNHQMFWPRHYRRDTPMVIRCYKKPHRVAYLLERSIAKRGIS